MSPREWHSKKSGVGVYHNNRNCGPGKSIKSGNRVSGRGKKKRLCKKCQE